MSDTYTVIVDDMDNPRVEILRYADASEETLMDLAGLGHDEAMKELVRRDIQATKAVEPDMVKVYRNAIDRAVQMLADLPTNDEGKIAVPWILRDRPKIETDRWADADLRSFPIEQMYATQEYVSRETVQWHLEHLNESAQDNRAMPNILVHGREFLIYDGHHRLVALWLLGADTANCWKLEI